MYKWVTRILGFLFSGIVGFHIREVFTYLPIWVTILAAFVIMFLWLLISEPEVRKWMWQIYQISWPPFLIVTVSMLLVITFYLWMDLGYLLMPPEIHLSRTSGIKILKDIKEIPPSTNVNGDRVYIQNNNMIAKQKLGGEYELYHDRTKLAEVFLKLNGQTEIRYFDKNGKHFLTDYIDATSQVQYVEYDRGRSGNWESIPNPHLFPIPVLIPLPIFGY